MKAKGATLIQRVGRYLFTTTTETRDLSAAATTRNNKLVHIL